ncbi:MAG: tetratricopeptide repeat protein [Terriglobia bacterium]
MPHISRHELKEDQFKTSVEEFEDFIKNRYKEIATVAGIAIVVAGLAVGLKVYQGEREAQANELLGAALRTYRAYVGTASETNMIPGTETFPTARDKYKKALEQFQEVVAKYSRVPRPKAVAIARYHVGVCQAQLGDHDGAVKSLQGASRDSDRNIASLAQYALAGEQLRAGKTDEAIKLFQELAAKPTTTVPETTARLALADAYRATQPAKAREIYQQLEKQFGSDVAVAQVLKEQLASLPK